MIGQTDAMMRIGNSHSLLVPPPRGNGGKQYFLLLLPHMKKGGNLPSPFYDVTTLSAKVS